MIHSAHLIVRGSLFLSCLLADPNQTVMEVQRTDDDGVNGGQVIPEIHCHLHNLERIQHQVVPITLDDQYIHLLPDGSSRVYSLVHREKSNM